MNSLDKFNKIKKYFDNKKLNPYISPFNKTTSDADDLSADKSKLRGWVINEIIGIGIVNIRS